jgi:hypothetical protein
MRPILLNIMLQVVPAWTGFPGCSCCIFLCTQASGDQQLQLGELGGMETARFRHETAEPAMEFPSLINEHYHHVTAES